MTMRGAGLVKAYTGLNAVGKVLVGFGVLLGLASLAFYAVVALGPSVTSFGDNEHRWEGGVLLAEQPKKSTRSLTCTVRPDQGEERTIRAVRVTRRLDADTALVQPWFSGGATVTCERVYSDRPTVRTGLMAQARLFFAKPLYDFLIVVVVAIPIAAGFVLGRRKA